MKRSRTLLCCLLMLGALSNLACGSSEPSTAEAAIDGEPATKTRMVVTAPVREIEFRDAVELSAEVTPWAAVEVAAEATGRVIELPVDVGDRVGKGTVVARIDGTILRAELARSEAELAQARATLVQAERDLARGEQLEETQDISIDDLDRLRLARDTAASQVAALEAMLDKTRQNVEDTEVKAPFAGVVSERLVEVGSWIAPGSTIVRLVDDRRLKVRGSASQRDRARIRPGLRAEVRVDALPGAVFEARVRLLGQEADPRTGSYLVEAQVDEPRSAGKRLLPGMQGALSVELAARTTLMVPRAALLQTPAGEGLFVVRDGVATFVQPETGAVTADQIEILSQLEDGERVVTIGQHVLRDGDRVVIDEERSAAASVAGSAP